MHRRAGGTSTMLLSLFRHRSCISSILEHRMTPFAPAFRAVYAGLVAILLSACVGDSTAQTANPPAVKAAPAVPTVPVAPSTHFALPDFAPLVERYGPAVVNIQVVERAQNSAESGQQGDDDPFQDFFRRFGIPA